MCITVSTPAPASFCIAALFSLVLQVVTSACWLCAGSFTHYRASNLQLITDACRTHRDRIVCTNTQAHVILALTVLMMVWAFVYFGLYFFYLSRSVYKLRNLPRQDHKLAHLMVNLQARPFPPPSI